MTGRGRRGHRRPGLAGDRRGRPAPASARRPSGYENRPGDGAQDPAALPSRRWKLCWHWRR